MGINGIFNLLANIIPNQKPLLSIPTTASIFWLLCCLAISSTISKVNSASNVSKFEETLSKINKKNETKDFPDINNTDN